MWPYTKTPIIESCFAFRSCLRHGWIVRDLHPAVPSYVYHTLTFLGVWREVSALCKVRWLEPEGRRKRFDKLVPNFSTDLEPFLELWAKSGVTSFHPTGCAIAADQCARAIITIFGRGLLRMLDQTLTQMVHILQCRSRHASATLCRLT